MKYAALLALALPAIVIAQPAISPPAGLDAAMTFSFEAGLVTDAKADRIAWTTIAKGVRNVWTAKAPDFRAVVLTHATDDDGQELTSLVLSPDGTRAVWVRGGDHDENWPAEGNLQPDPASGTAQPQLVIWSTDTRGGVPIKIGEGDAPALSASGQIAFVRDGKVWSADAGGKAKPAQLFFDRGKASALAWSPDGSRLAFVSRRDDHSFVGIYTAKDRPIVWLAPSTGQDEDPVWSPDGHRVAFTRRPGKGGAPEPMLSEVPQPWSIIVADATSGEGGPAWRSPRTLEGSYPAVADGAALMWAAGDRLTFRAELDGWPHLYSVPTAGGEAMLLTPGPFMVEHVALSHDRKSLVYDANSGPATEDDDRRHVFRVAVDRPGPVMITHGVGIESTPVTVAGDRVAYVSSSATRPAEMHIVGSASDTLIGASAADYAAAMVTPQRVTFTSADGLLIHGQLFAPSHPSGKRPAVIFVHGGPPRQMLLGFSYMDYYAHAYAMNQYLASRGFIVLSVNYRLGIGYGRAFQHAAKAGPAGGSEYRDVQAGAKFLQSLPLVDPERIGIWGGSYGGYLTAMALARDSATFKTGVDFHGVHDWSRLLGEEVVPPKRYEQGDRDAAMKTAFESSPVADVATWRSPVLLIHGDDDRNVRFNQTIDLARRLDQRGVAYEELILPNEIHGFLRYQDWLKADAATVRFLEAKLTP